MKKSTILSLATAIAVVGTSAFTFATWDQLDASTTASLTIAAPVTMELENLTLTDSTRELGDTVPIYSGSATLTVDNIPESQKENYEIDYETKVYDGSADNEGTILNNVTTTAVESTPATELNGVHTVDVTVTPPDSTVAGKSLTVKVTAKLVRKSAS